MRRRQLTLGVLCLLATTAGAGELRYVGSSTVGRFIADAAQVYRDATFDVHVNPESAGGERCSRLGTCDLGGVARELSRGERNNGVVGTLIGWDAIAVVVHPGNPVRELSATQIRGIFTGEIRSWADLGGLKIPVTPHIVDWNSATREVFREALLGGHDYAGCTVDSPDRRVPQEVSRNIGAIGHISASFLAEYPGVRALRIDGREPVAGRSGYPVLRPLYLATRGQPHGEAGAFIRWALSAEGQQVVRRRFAGVH